VFQVASLAAGSYDVEVKHSMATSRKKTGLLLTGGESEIFDFGTLATGDSDNSNQIDIVDFSLLRSVFSTATPCGNANPAVASYAATSA
jgi:hypothetical protein